MTTKKQEGRHLNPRSYRTLLEQIAALYKAAETSSSRAKLESTWNIGRRIAAARLSAEAGYHNSILRDLAKDAGVSSRSLQEGVAFHAAYPELPRNTPLGWSHYRQLLRLESKERQFFENQAHKELWSARHLGEAIAQHRAEELAAAGEAMHRPADPTYLYRASVTQIIDADTLDVAIDLGFQVTRHQRLRLAHVDAPEVATPAGRAARDYLYRTLKGALTMVVTTERVDLHGRYVAHLFTSKSKQSAHECFLKGRHINAALIQAGHGYLSLQ